MRQNRTPGRILRRRGQVGVGPENRTEWCRPLWPPILPLWWSFTLLLCCHFQPLSSYGSGCSTSLPVLHSKRMEVGPEGSFCPSDSLGRAQEPLGQSCIQATVPSPAKTQARILSISGQTAVDLGDCPTLRSQAFAGPAPVCPIDLSPGWSHTSSSGHYRCCCWCRRRLGWDHRGPLPLLSPNN